jgi:nickel/cobalt transporter (NicO) family protein
VGAPAADLGKLSAVLPATHELSTLSALLAAAATIGVVHTVFGPDHYIPFVALARSRSWTLRRTWTVTAICGVGHVLGSVVLGLVGIALGWAVGSLVGFESIRGGVAGWLLLGFGLAYTVWGIRQGVRNRPHSHLHAHADGSVHAHTHGHRAEHAHPHDAHEARATTDAEGRAIRQAFLKRWLGPWTLFVVFVLGPCEPLIPLLLYPASQHSWFGTAAVAVVFSIATISTMLVVVTVGALGLSRLPGASLERWSHALAGVALAACGVAITLGL